MPALVKIKPKSTSAAAAPGISSAPADQVRVKRRLELLAERTVEQACELIDKRIDEREDLSRDDVAVVEHASSNAIRVFNLGAASQQGSASASPLSDRAASKRSVFRVRLFDFGKEKVKQPSRPAQVQGG